MLQKSELSAHHVGPGRATYLQYEIQHIFKQYLLFCKQDHVFSYPHRAAATQEKKKAVALL